MTILAIPGGAFDSVFTPSAGFAVVNGAWRYGWDGASGDGGGPIKAIIPEAANAVPNWNPATIVDTNTTYNVASIHVTMDSILSDDINESGGGVVLIDVAQTGLYIKLTGDEVGSGGGYFKLKIMSLTAAVEGSAIVEYSLPVVSGPEISLDVSYNKFTKEVVIYFNGAFLAKYNYASAPTDLRIGIGAYRGSGASNYHTSVQTAFNAIPHLKQAESTDTDYRDNAASTLPNITAAVDDHIIFDITYRYRDIDTLVVTTPTWNGQTFTEFGSPSISSFCITQTYYLKVTSAGTAAISAAFTGGLDEFNISAAAALVYGGVGTHTFASPITQRLTTGDTWVQPSLTYTSLAKNDIALDLLNLSGFDNEGNNQTNTPFTPSANQFQVLYRAPTDRALVYAGNLYATETYGVGSQTATWTAGAPAIGYGVQNLYYNLGVVLKAPLTGSDSTPDAFTLTAQTDVNPSTAITSNTFTVAGIDASSAISISGAGQYSKNGGAFTSSAGTVVVGDTVAVQLTSSASYSTGVSTILTIGGVTGTFTVTTRAADTTPDAFTFTTVSGAAISTLTESGSITVAGVDAGQNVAISVSGGEYAVSTNGGSTYGAFTTSAGNVQLGHVVKVRNTSSSSTNTTVTTTLTIGGVSGTFSTVTGTPDTAPDAFTFTAQTAVNPSTAIDSNAITIAGVTAGVDVAITVTGGQYAVSTDGGSTYGAFTSSAGNVRLGNLVKARVTSSASYTTGASTTVTIGGIGGTFTATTRAIDTTPSAFTFASITSADTGSTQTSASITVAGIDAGATPAISISGGGSATYSKNGGAYTATAGTVVAGDVITVRQVASNAAATALVATLTIGGVTGTFSVTTATPALTAVGNGTVAAGQTSVTLTTTGFGAVTSVTIGGVPATALAGSNGSWTITAPDMVDGGDFPLLGSAVAVVIGNGTATASRNITFTQRANQGVQTLTSVPASSIGYIGNYSGTIGAAIGDPVFFDTAASLATASGQTVPSNGVDVDGRIFSDYSGVQTMYLRKASTGKIVAITVTTPALTDTVPDAFTFTAATGAEISTVTTSSPATVAGINATSAISIVGGTYSINGGSYVSTAGSVNVNDVVRVRVTSNAAYNAVATATVTIGGVTGTFSVTTRAADLTPDALTFTPVTGATLSTAYVSNNATIAGIDAAQNVAISITGGQYAISTNGGTSFGSYTASAGNVQLGHVVRIQATASSSSNTPVTATLTVGGVASAYVVTTASANDTTPDAFTFTAQTGVNAATQVESNTIVIAGVTTGIDVPVSITGGQFAIDSGSGFGAFTSTATVVRLGYSVKVRVTSSSSYLTAASTTLTVGGVTGAFSATTRAADTTPSAFTFTPATGAEISTVTTSNSITVTGVDAGQNVVVTITGGTYSVNGGAYTSLSSNVVLNDTISVRVTSSASYSTAASATLDVGSVTGQFSVTTRAVDTAPTAFSFASVGGATQGATVESASFTVAGVDAGQDVAISISNGQYAVNTGSGFGAFTASAGVVRLGYVVKVSAVAASSANTDTVAVLTVGGVTGSFTVSTGIPDDTVPDAFTFTAVTSASISTSYDSNAVTIAGVTSGANVPVSVVGGTYSINTGSGFGAFTSSPGNIQLGHQIKVRVGTGSAYNTATTATVTIGTVPSSFVVTTRVADTTPDAFTLTAVTGATPSTVYTSSVVAVAGVDAAVDVPITITGTGTYAIDPGTGTYGSYVNTPGVVRLGYNVKVHLTSSNLGDTTVTSTLSIGGVTAVYSVNTGTIDTVPDAYSFTAVNNSEVNTVTESSVIQIAGVSSATDVAISITGGSYSINSGSGYGAFVTTPGVVRLGYSVKVRLTTSSAYATANTATLTVGGVTGAFVVTTRAADLTPSAFTFTAATAVNPAIAVESNSITVAGVDAAQDVAISISGGSYAINTGSGFGSFTSSPGVVRLGHIVKVRVTSNASFNASASTTLTVGGVTGTFTATTRVADTTPNAFTFAPVLSAAISALYESNVITVAGVDAGVDIAISIVGGEWLSNDGSGWSEPTAGAGVVRLGNTVKIQVTSPSTVPATETGVLTIGGVSSTYSVSTSATDITPDAFTFNAVTDAPLSTAFFSNTITLAGIDAGQRVAISIQGGQYRVTSAAGVDGPWQFTASTIALSDKVTVYCSSGSAYGVTSNATLTISGVSGIFAVTTRAADTTPRALTFNPLTNALVSTVYESNVNVISAVDPGVDIGISITGGEYAIAVGSSFSAYTAEPGIIQGGQSVKVRVTSSGNESTDASATLTVGDVTGTYTVTTRGPAEGNVDIIPDPFTLTSVTNAAMNTVFNSNIITVTDITEGIPVSINVTGATFYIDAGNGFGAQLTSSSIVKLGYRVKLAVRSSNYFETAVNATLNIGGVVGVYTVITRSPKVTPAPIVLPSIVNAKPNTLYTSTQAAITGIETGATATLSTVNGLEYAINRGKGYEAWTSQSTQVKSTDLIKTRLRSPTTAGTSKIGKLVIASVVNNFTIYNK